jgi:transposase
MGLLNDVENRMGESVTTIMKRNAVKGKSIRECSLVMDVSYSTAHRWANKYNVKFNKYNNKKWQKRWLFRDV